MKLVDDDDMFGKSYGSSDVVYFVMELDVGIMLLPRNESLVENQRNKANFSAFSLSSSLFFPSLFLQSRFQTFPSLMSIVVVIMSFK